MASMVRNFLIPPAIAAVTAGIGLGVCAICKINPHVQEMWIALVVTLAAAELAMIPLVIVRNKTTLEVSQAGLVATVIHLLVSAAGGLSVMQWIHQGTHPRPAFLYWLCAFYWTALAGVCRVLIRAIKAAPNPTGPVPGGSTVVSERASKA
jgi:ABC-type Fe3+-siderophore transport system permease subunit